MSHLTLPTYLRKGRSLLGRDGLSPFSSPSPLHGCLLDDICLTLLKGAVGTGYR